jgi:glycosyltransferase involved in cell wall biosynthesis
MPSGPSIGVIIPCYNDGVFLPGTLTSVFAQTHKPDRILIVNDGSTDRNTKEILSNINAPTVTVIHQNNRGLAAARNTGMRNCDADYVYILDADDTIAPECLATLSLLLEKHEDAVAAVSRVQLFGGPNCGMLWGEPLNPYIIRVQNQWGAGIMLRKAAVNELDLWYDESMRSGYEDWELHIRLAKTNKAVVFCPEALYHYQVRKTSLLSKTRQCHEAVVNYIQTKHSHEYTFENLLKAKRAHAPALVIEPGACEKSDLVNWLARQSFRDWALADTASPGGRYRLYYSDVHALHRLPSEALECAFMALECYGHPLHCVLAVRQGSPPLFAQPGNMTGLSGQRYPVALVTRVGTNNPKIAVEEALSRCPLLIEFIDQDPSSPHGWAQGVVRFLPNSLMTGFAGPESVRRNLRSLGRHILNKNLQNRLVQLYDHIYYRVLCSEEAFALKRKIRQRFGIRWERMASALAYGLFLAQPPMDDHRNETGVHRTLNEKLSPLFLTPADNRVHVLIATAWLVEGGVEQIIFELCRLLEPSRFRLTIVTTLPSHHAWDGWARALGASVYHLADFLKPADMARGLMHFVINHRVDCMFIMNSEIAYRAASALKRFAPWLPIVDRIEAPDPGGGYPMVSARVGKSFIDLRTVSHQKLAQYMRHKYELSQDGLKTIYIGTNERRISDATVKSSGLLHDKCRLNHETPIVLFVGRFAHQKRPEIFVRSVAKIFKINAQCTAHFAMIGDGHLIPSVTTLISKLDLDKRIHLLGAHSNAVELMRDATLLMMPSAYEGLALVSYEAMALGIPQIFANVGGQDELITPETGILIDNGRGEETRYAEACLELLSDPERRARMAAAGKERIRNHFTAENAVKQYAEIFEQMAKLSQKRAAEIPHLRPPHVNPLHELY